MTSGANQPAPSADVTGDWYMEWHGRLGTEQCKLHIDGSGSHFSGTFEDFRGTSTFTAALEGNRLSFDVPFRGPRPFTIRFNGVMANGEISGTSQAQDVSGPGAYLGHGGEIVQPEHPWIAQRQPFAKDKGTHLSALPRNE